MLLDHTPCAILETSITIISRSWNKLNCTFFQVYVLPMIPFDDVHSKGCLTIALHRFIQPTKFSNTLCFSESERDVVTATRYVVIELISP